MPTLAISAQKANPPYDIALSFAGENRDYVEQVATLLSAAGVKVFYDRFEEANLWGKNLYEYLIEIYRDKAFYTVMFISKHYAEKAWPTHERKAMQARAFQENQEYILPARFDDTPLPGLLETIHYVSLAERTPRDIAELVQKKLVLNGRSVPSESLRRTLFSTELLPRVNPTVSQVTVISENGTPIPRATVVAIADNNTFLSADTAANGVASLTVATRRMFNLFVAHSAFPAAVRADWDPKEDVKITLTPTESIGSLVCHSTGYIPGLTGRLNLILDSHNRTYLYADNIAINGGKQQPVHFQLNVPFELEDAHGVVMQVRILAIRGRTSLLEYARPIEASPISTS